MDWSSELSRKTGAKALVILHSRGARRWKLLGRYGHQIAVVAALFFIQDMKDEYSL
jgi:hypothetical protein